MASFITTTAFLGVYTVFKQVLDMEKNTRLRWHNQSQAESIVTHIAETLDSCLNLPDIPALFGGPDPKQGGYFLRCLVDGKGYSGGSSTWNGMRRRHYSWNTGTEENNQYSVELQELKYAGTRMLSPITGLEDLDEEQIWLGVPAQTIGKNVDAISILYKPIDDVVASWQGDWKGPVGNVAVWIKVECQGQLAERIVVPRVNVAANP